jgi:hypothetical protein
MGTIPLLAGSPIPTMLKMPKQAVASKNTMPATIKRNPAIHDKIEDSQPPAGKFFFSGTSMVVPYLCAAFHSFAASSAARTSSAVMARLSVSSFGLSQQEMEYHL